MPYIGDIMKIKKIILVLCAFFSGAFVFSKAPYRAEVQESFKLNKYNRKLGYQITEGGNKIVFVFDAASYNIAKPTKPQLFLSLCLLCTLEKTIYVE